jgi:FkbM family methyltransferase
LEKSASVILTPWRDTYTVYGKLVAGGFKNVFGIMELNAGDHYIEKRNTSEFINHTIQASEEKIKTAKALLKDEKSKNVFDARLRAYLHDDWIALETFTENRQYFCDDIIRLERAKEVFVDCGAFDFETSLEFIFLSNNSYQHIYAFEPSPAYIRLIELCRERYRLKNVTIFPYAVGDRKRNVLFDVYDSIGGMAVNAAGDMTCAMESLDGLLLEKKAVPTFIKMDIEGMEVYALKGAAKIIARDSPKLAISVYHKLEHLWEVPLGIHGMNPKYDFYMRQHAAFAETVCYAIPQ